MPSGLKIRKAKLSDAGRIAVLSGRLGYPATTKEMVARLRQVLRSNQSACFVAATEEDGLIGWVHASITPLLEVPRRAEVNGLVVEEKVRSRGVGGALLEAAEKWAKRKSCVGMSVKSNVMRDRAHRFYVGHGYEHYKTQKAFRKTL